MKKLLGILVLSLLLSGNSYSEVLSWNCGNSKNLKWINWQLDLKKKILTSQFYEKHSGKTKDQKARVVSEGHGHVIVQDYIKGLGEWNTNTWEFNYNSEIYTVYNNKKFFYGDCIEVTNKSITEELKELKKLYDEGVLTKEQFEKAKNILLN